MAKKGPSQYVFFFLFISVNAHHWLLLFIDAGFWRKAPREWALSDRNNHVPDLFCNHIAIPSIVGSENRFVIATLLPSTIYKMINRHCDLVINHYPFFAVTFYSNTCGLIGIAILLNVMCISMAKEKKYTGPPKFLTQLFSGCLGKLLCLGNYSHQVRTCTVLLGTL